MIWALSLLAVVVVVLLVNGGSVSVNLIAADIQIMKAFAFLGFTAIGILIGVLLR